ncbi:MAG TPA: hypothetical protein VH583_13165 [Vicinamibacterales bacterium]|jgi:hypothetical protein
MTQPASELEGDHQRQFYILQILVGGTAFGLCAALIPNRIAGESAGFFAMCMAGFPFARRTWARHLTFTRYVSMAAFGTILGAAIRMAIRVVVGS